MTLKKFKQRTNRQTENELIDQLAKLQGTLLAALGLYEANTFPPNRIGDEKYIRQIEKKIIIT